MSKITIITRVHNPGAYIYRCVDSVLNQSFTDFTFLVIDNASSDGAKEILEDYALKDSRIQLLRNESNNVTMLHCIQNLVATDYFMVLDHDDWLEPSALETLYLYAEQEQLDLTFGRTNFVNESDAYMETRGLPQTRSIPASQLPEYLPAVYWQLRTTWATLIKSSVSAYIDADAYHFRAPSRYGGDTVMMLSMTFSASRIGFVNNIVHNYRIHPASDRNNYRRERFLADWFLFDFAKNLLEKVNGFTPRNQEFLYCIYGHAVCDTITAAIHSGQSYNAMLDIALEILQHEHTQNMIPFIVNTAPIAERFRSAFGPSVRNLFLHHPEDEKAKQLLFCWVRLLYSPLSLEESDYSMLIGTPKLFQNVCLGNDSAVYSELFENPHSYGPPYARIKLALLLKYERDIKELATRLLSLQNQIDNFYEKIAVPIDILASQNKLLQGICQKDYPRLSEIILLVCSLQYEKALALCMDKIQNEPIENIVAPLQLAIRLSALLEQAELFISLKRLECSLYIEQRDVEKARIVLADLYDMCQQDPQIQELQTLLDAISS